MPLLLSSVANAVPPNGLTVTQQDGRTTAAAGTCTAFTVTPRNVLSTDTIDPATVTVRIAESPASDTQDVDFCTVEGETPFAQPPGYTNAVQIGGDPDQEGGETLQTYAPGPSITPPTNGGTGPSGSAGNPDVASGAQPATFANATSVNNRNPNGADTTIYRTTGPIVFGVVALTPGSVTVEAFVDENTASGDRPRRRDSSEITSGPRTLTITPGGRQGSAEAADAVKRVELVDVPDGDEESVATQGSGGSVATHDLEVSLFNANGDRVSGVRPVLRPLSGPNAPSAFAPNGTFTASCDQVFGQAFAARCTYSAAQTGRDLLVAFVNQSNGTANQDGNEPADTVAAVTTPPTNTNPAAARFLNLTPEAASIPAGERRPFTATITDAAGAPVQGVQVRFDESGAGAFVNPSTQTATPTVTMTTDGLGQAVVQFASTASESGGTNTITATIATAGTQCTAQASGSTPAGRCSDTSSVTLTAATASPSPSASTSTSPRPSSSASARPSASTSTGPSTTGSRYRGLASPVRVLDTRDNRGIRRSGEIVLDLSQRLNDAEATAAVLNVTVTNPTARGFLVAYPNGNAKPGTSNVNFEANQTQANEVVVGLSSSKRVSLFVDSASAHVVVDLVGSFTRDAGTDTGRVVTNAPVRAFDSRTTATPRRTGEVVVDLSSRLPDGATDAILNVTVQGPSARGYVVVFPSGTTRPGTSNVNFERGQTQANEVVTRVGTGSNAGRVSLFIDSASSALIVDVVGAVVSSATGAQSFTALEQPVRALDTRNSNGARRSGEVTVAMPSSVPSSATGVILNVTATNGTRSGFVAVYPAGSANPGTSNVNFPVNLTQANEVTTRLGSNRSVTLFVGGSGTPAAHLIVDVVGYLTS